MEKKIKVISNEELNSMSEVFADMFYEIHKPKVDFCWELTDLFVEANKQNDELYNSDDLLNETKQKLYDISYKYREYVGTNVKLMELVLAIIDNMDELLDFIGAIIKKTKESIPECGAELPYLTKNGEVVF